MLQNKPQFENHEPCPSDGIRFEIEVDNRAEPGNPLAALAALLLSVSDGENEDQDSDTDLKCAG